MLRNKMCKRKTSRSCEACSQCPARLRISMTDNVRESIGREMEGNIFMHSGAARGGREVEANALIIQYSAQYRGTARSSNASILSYFT